MTSANGRRGGKREYQRELREKEKEKESERERGERGQEIGENAASCTVRFWTSLLPKLAAPFPLYGSICLAYCLPFSIFHNVAIFQGNCAHFMDAHISYAAFGVDTAVKCQTLERACRGESGPAIGTINRPPGRNVNH